MCKGFYMLGCFEWIGIGLGLGPTRKSFSKNFRQVISRGSLRILDRPLTLCQKWKLLGSVTKIVERDTLHVSPSLKCFAALLWHVA